MHRPELPLEVVYIIFEKVIESIAKHKDPNPVETINHMLCVYPHLETLVHKHCRIIKDPDEMVRAIFEMIDSNDLTYFLRMVFEESLRDKKDGVYVKDSIIWLFPYEILDGNFRIRNTLCHEIIERQHLQIIKDTELMIIGQEEGWFESIWRFPYKLLQTFSVLLCHTGVEIQLLNENRIIRLR